MESKPLAFQFTKSVKKSNVIKTRLNELEGKGTDSEVDFVKSVDGNVIESSKPQLKPTGPLVIPLKRVRLGVRPATGKESISSLDQEAADELIRDVETTVDGDGVSGLDEIQAKASSLSQGAVIGSVPTLDDYDSVPVQEFGKALLRGMGWKELPADAASQVRPFEPQLRPKGLGLGASARAAQEVPTTDDKQPLAMKSGAYVCVAAGKDKGLYGEVTSLDGEGRALVKMAITEQVRSLPEVALQLVSKKHYKRNSKVINQEKYDAYRDEQQLPRDPVEENPLTRPGNRRGADGNRHRDNKHRSKHKHGHKSKPSDETGSKAGPPWVRPQLRVRCIDPRLLDGKYFRQKLDVVDVAAADRCVCADEAGRLLEAVNPRLLETVVPREAGAALMVVRGPLTTHVGHILERDARACRVTLQLLPDEDVHTFHYDDVCQFTGSLDTFR